MTNLISIFENYRKKYALILPQFQFSYMVDESNKDMLMYQITINYDTSELTF